jgi:hypothetical protein
LNAYIYALGVRTISVSTEPESKINIPLQSTPVESGSNKPAQVGIASTSRAGGSQQRRNDQERFASGRTQDKTGTLSHRTKREKSSDGVRCLEGVPLWRPSERTRVQRAAFGFFPLGAQAGRIVPAAAKDH